MRNPSTDDLQILPHGFYPYDEVHLERVRAHKKHGARNNSREHAAWNNEEWLPILMEELGEVAHELTYDSDDNQSTDQRDRLRKELIQVAAMACAWIAAIDDSRYEHP
jgi:NTP pyrophosphatase (non-canonical NTP hydrolase)